MPKLDANELRRLSDKELADELVESRSALLNLRFRKATMQLDNVNEVGQARKKVAQLLTIIQERKLVGGK
ncbi:MAG: large subunit ribosomal protein L29 [Chloroflexi bacterium]|nr:MAG: large subunit ribosomal protein L29 [Chloroflexota bacterium]